MSYESDEADRIATVQSVQAHTQANAPVIDHTKFPPVNGPEADYHNSAARRALVARINTACDTPQG